ncbi:MAG: efflux RND transporter periplasmic adaptor subunit [Alphaproteobacteria bacterium]|nr:efflux RND transporter periplasmic adaptor subunit [Alphaproteobacteria bacterium]
MITRRVILLSGICALSLTAMGIGGYAAYANRAALGDAIARVDIDIPVQNIAREALQNGQAGMETFASMREATLTYAAQNIDDFTDVFRRATGAVTMSAGHVISTVSRTLKDAGSSLGRGAVALGGSAIQSTGAGVNHIVAAGGDVADKANRFAQSWQPAPEPPPVLTLTEMIVKKDEQAAAIMADISPASGDAKARRDAPEWTPEQTSLTVEAVLVPKQVTVVSSSRDGRIAQIMVDHGDTFTRGDILIAYDCAGLEAEAEIVGMEKDLTKKKIEGSDRLFKLDIISDLDRLGIQVEDKRADAKMRLVEAKMDDCRIRAEFDGRVTNRLANPGEYTRTDRVLLEVASAETLQAEFLLPSKWLRWVNVGAPLTINVSETEHVYEARVSPIYGEVDPVSQSIQMVASLEPYQDPLLPGMSGQAVIDIDAIRKAGVKGFLQVSERPLINGSGTATPE